MHKYVYMYTATTFQYLGAGETATPRGGSMKP